MRSRRTWRLFRRRGLSMKALLTVADLAAYLHKSVTSIRGDVSRNPRSLPPICRLPGTKRLLWRVEDVEKWLADHVSGVSFSTEPDTSLVRSKPGRPTKSQQVRKQKAGRQGREALSDKSVIGV